jgi:hypothetical protein
VEVGRLAAGQVHEVGQNGRAESTIDRDAFAVNTVDKIDDFLRRAELDLLDEAMIADHRQLAKGSIEKVSGNITDLPSGREGLKIPFHRAKVTEQFDEPGVYATKEGSAEDGFGAGDIFGHGMELWYRLNLN